MATSTPQVARDVALFEKCKGFTKAREVQAMGLYPYFTPIHESEDTVVKIDGKTKVMMGSNNYLGLTHHPKVLEAAEKALHKYGSGCSGSRFLNGTLDLHEILEAKLAEFFGKESCLIFSTGYQANLGLVSGLVGRGETVYLDKLDHASIVDGAKLSFGDVVRFNHGDLEGLERKLQREDGPKGAGTAEHFGLTQETDLIVGTFSKSLASIGGFVASDEYVIHYLKHHARPLIFTAALPASNTAGVLAALEILRSEPERRVALWENTRRLQEGLRSLCFDIGLTETPIIPVLIGTLENTFLFWRKLFDAGVFTNPVVPPAVPPAECRLRTSLMATHTPDQIDFAIDTFAKLGKEMGVI